MKLRTLALILVNVLLLAGLLVFFALPYLFGDQLPWIEQGKGLYRTQRDCGIYEGMSNSSPGTVFYLRQESSTGSYLTRIWVNSDYWPMEMEGGLDLYTGTPVCIVRHHSPGGSPDRARIEYWIDWLERDSLFPFRSGEL